MEVILLENIGNLGALGDTVDVKPGYGRNFLIPQGKAVPATQDNVAKFETRRAELEAAAAETLAAAQARGEALTALEAVNIAATAGSDLPGLTLRKDMESPFIGFGSNCGCFGSNSDTCTNDPFHSLTISLYGNSIPDLSDIALAYLPVAYLAIMFLGSML